VLILPILGADEVVGAFDATISYDLSLFLDDVQFSPLLGDEFALEAVPFFIDFFGSVDVVNVSLLSTAELAALQPAGGFTLATLLFSSIDPNPITASFGIDRSLVAIEVVPVPGALWLFVTALVGLVGFGKRRNDLSAANQPFS